MLACRICGCRVCKALVALPTTCSDVSRVSAARSSTCLCVIDSFSTVSPLSAAGGRASSCCSVAPAWSVDSLQAVCNGQRECMARTPSSAGWVVWGTNLWKGTHMHTRSKLSGAVRRSACCLLHTTDTSTLQRDKQTSTLSSLCHPLSWAATPPKPPAGNKSTRCTEARRVQHHSHPQHPK